MKVWKGIRGRIAMFGYGLVLAVAALTFTDHALFRLVQWFANINDDALREAAEEFDAERDRP